MNTRQQRINDLRDAARLDSAADATDDRTDAELVRIAKIRAQGRLGGDQGPQPLPYPKGERTYVAAYVTHRQRYFRHPGRRFMFEKPAAIAKRLFP
jgi:hypothetical protein